MTSTLFLIKGSKKLRNDGDLVELANPYSARIVWGLSLIENANLTEYYKNGMLAV